MKVSQLFGQTLREAPKNIDMISAQLLLRAGYIKQILSGVYSYLPLAQRAIQKIERILRQEIHDINGQEISLPVVQPAELWQESGRWEHLDQTLVRFKDRKNRPLVLSMTHEECLVDVVRGEIASYKQLPLLLFHIQTKFRDELRPRGGLIRTREFTMKDSYSLDLDQEGLDKQYQAHYNAYLKIGKRVGLTLLPVESDCGIHGGARAHEFMYAHEQGEDKNLLCTSCGYAANQEVATFKPSETFQDTPEAITEVYTPGSKTIKELANQLKIKPLNIAKSTFFMLETIEGPALVLAVVRGDMEVNEIKLLQLFQAHSLRPATHEELEEIGAVPGFASPLGLRKELIKIVVDEVVSQSTNLVMGANKVDHHVLNVTYNRDYYADQIAEIALADANQLCSHCQSHLTMIRGIEVGNIFQLGTRYSQQMSLNYKNNQGQSLPVFMGSYGIGVGRLLACIAEEYHDENGLIWPISVAPFQVYLLTVGENSEMMDYAFSLYQKLSNSGIEVLFDERAVKAGVKFKDADLRGLPIRVTISERNLNQGLVEVKLRSSQDKQMVSKEEVQEYLHRTIRELHLLYS